jgi:hypothetical protein
MQTATERKFWPLDPRESDIHIEDIAHALSMICRFGGHCRVFYSVAEHSVRVSTHVEALGGERWHQLAALLHDSPEAYIGDMVRPLKRMPEMEGFRDAEERIARAICSRFCVFSLDTPLIQTADEALLATEARDIMGGESAGKWTLHAEPQTQTIEPWSMEMARAAFLGRFHALT